MKGSDKWGGGSGPRIEFVLAALVVVSLAGVYFFYLEGTGLNSGNREGVVTTVSTTGVACDSGNLPHATLLAEEDPIFTNLSNGLCYNFMGQSAGAMTFARYDGTITYPCGDSPVQSPASVIVVNVTAAQKVTAAQLLAPSSMAVQGEACDPSIPVDVVSVQDVGSTIPAVPQLNLTLAVPDGGRPIASLRAVLTLDGGSQIFKFDGVTSTTALAPRQSISATEIVLSNLSFNASEVYPLTISGTFEGGQAFSHQAHVQIAQVP